MDKKFDMIEIIQALMGSVEPYAETNIDTQHLENLKEWCDLHRRITEIIAKAANASNLRRYYSANKIIEEARYYLTDINADIATWWDNWKAEDEAEDENESDLPW